MTKALSPPLTPEALRKKRKLRWLHAVDAIQCLQPTIEEKTLPRDQCQLIQISDAGPDFLHEFAMIKGLDLQEAIADHESGKMG